MKYRLSANSGLRASQAALGAMTLSEGAGWGATENEASSIEADFPTTSTTHK
jgi:aryl-alcohol dehydrogenase-like predicted oxidoreductase